MAKSKEMMCVWMVLLLGVATVWAGGNVAGQTAWPVGADMLSVLGDPDGGCIASAETKSGTIFPVGDTDAYTFYGQVGQGVVIEMADNSTPRVLHPLLQLYDPNGDRVAEAGDLVSWITGSASYSYKARIDNCKLRMTGVYTVVVSGLYLSTGEYGLSLAVAPGAATSPRDPNGGDIASGETKVGNISPAGDTDICAFYGQAGQGVVIEMADNSTPRVLHPLLQLYDPNGDRVAEAGDLVSWITGSASYSYKARIDNHKLRMTGVYTIVASGLYLSTGEYGLSLSLTQPKDPCGSYPYGPQPPDGNSVSLCDQNTLSWCPVTRATGYDVYLVGGPCTPLEKVAQNTAHPSLSMPALDANEVYYWQVVAHTPVGDIRGPVWWFATVPCPNLVIYDFPLDNEPGWTMNGQWKFGVPTGQGGGACDKHGNPDPASGRTGQNVFGVNLNGDYEVGMGGPYSLVAGPFDLRGYRDVRLGFARWLNTDEPRYVTATVDVSIDEKKTWRNLWKSETEITDSQWIPMECALGTEADGQPAVYLRWTYQVIKERAYPYSGWNLDDIQLIGRKQ